MGERGPVPNRSDERRRRNLPEDGIETSKVPGKAIVDWPEPNPDWHPIAHNFFLGLQDSGQSVFYQQSDIELAYFLAHEMSLHLDPQPVVIGRGEDAEIEMVVKPMKGTELSAFIKGMSLLGVTEGDRRRMKIELQYGAEDAEESPAEKATREAQEALGFKPTLLQGGAAS